MHADYIRQAVDDADATADFPDEGASFAGPAKAC